jgi:esterase/lipase superfamily enzyme
MGKIRFDRRYAVIVLLAALALQGCSSLPFKTSSSYFEDLYKRIRYTVEGRYRVVSVFYATSRKRDASNKSSVYFTNSISDSTTTGELDIRIDPRLKIEKMLPRRLERMGVIGIQSISAEQAGVFMKKLKSAVSDSPHKSLLVMIFGYKDDFESTAIKAAYFAYLLDINTPVLLFDWPGDQGVNPLGYEEARRLAVRSGPQLGELLARISEEIKPEKLWIQASSLGCQVVCDAIQHMQEYDFVTDSELEVDHIVLAAPDVSQNEFDKEFKDNLENVSRKVTAYVSSDDEALLISGMLNADPRLGRQRMRIKEPAEMEEMKELLYLKSLDPDKFTVIDVTPINRSSFKHGYYLECPEFFDDCYMRLFGTSPGSNRRLYLLKTKDRTDYWVLQGN